MGIGGVIRRLDAECGAAADISCIAHLISLSLPFVSAFGSAARGQMARAAAFRNTNGKRRVEGLILFEQKMCKK